MDQSVTTDLSTANSMEGPPFEHTVMHDELLSSDLSQIRMQINPLLDRGFFFANNGWTCYRRNYFRLHVSFALSSQAPFYVRYAGGIVPVTSFSVGVSARVHNAHKYIDLVQQSTKRTKTTQSVPTTQICAPICPDDQGTAFCERKPNTVVFERLQFKHSTANNGRRRSTQQFFVVIANLYALMGDSHEPILLASAESQPIIVRGRSPRHYGEYPSAKQPRAPPFVLVEPSLTAHPNIHANKLQPNPSSDLNAPEQKDQQDPANDAVLNVHALAAYKSPTFHQPAKMTPARSDLSPIACSPFSPDQPTFQKPTHPAKQPADLKQEQFQSTQDQPAHGHKHNRKESQRPKLSLNTHLTAIHQNMLLQNSSQSDCSQSALNLSMLVSPQTPSTAEIGAILSNMHTSIQGDQSATHPQTNMQQQHFPFGIQHNQSNIITRDVHFTASARQSIHLHSSINATFQKQPATTFSSITPPSQDHLANNLSSILPNYSLQQDAHPHSDFQHFQNQQSLYPSSSSQPTHFSLVNPIQTSSATDHISDRSSFHAMVDFTSFLNSSVSHLSMPSDTIHSFETSS